MCLLHPGCTLTSGKQELKVAVDDRDAEQQLALKVVCLRAEAEDKFHMVEVEGLTNDAKTTKVPLVVLKPSLHTPGKDRSQAGSSNSPSLTEIKSKLSTAAKEGKPLPKNEQKFENYVKSSFKFTDKQVVKDLWNFLKIR